MTGGHPEPDIAEPVRPQRVTIADVAQRLGLTKGTVSRALNGYPDIAEGTRLRVSKTASAMGYRPLSHAQAIRTGQVHALGLVLEIVEYDAHRPFLAEFLAGLTRGASAENWTLTVATSVSRVDTDATLARLVDERKADGFILPRTRRDDPRVRLLRDAGVPFVLYGRTIDTTGCAWFDIISEDAIRDAVLRLAKQGHRRIAFVNSGMEYNYSWVRYDGYLAGLDAGGLALAHELVAENAVLPEDGAKAAATLLSQPNPPTAFVYAVDTAAIGLYRTAAALGLKIGREISVIAYDGAPEGAHVQPPLTTFAVDNAHAGRRLAALLIERIRGTAPEELRELYPARLVVRESDGPPALTSEELAATLRGVTGHQYGRIL